jgi:hypothetical protein
MKLSKIFKTTIKLCRKADKNMKRNHKMITKVRR